MNLYYFEYKKTYKENMKSIEQNYPIPKKYTLIKLIFSSIAFLSFFINFKFNIVNFKVNGESVKSYSGIYLLFHSHGSVFIGSFILFLGLLCLLLISLSKFIEDYMGISMPLSYITRIVELKFIFYIIIWSVASGIYTAFNESQIGGMITLICIIYYFYIDIQERKFTN